MPAERNRIQTFFYEECPGTAAAPSWTGWGAVPDLAAKGRSDPSSQEPGVGHAASSRTPEAVAEELERAFAEGRERGIDEGRRQESEAHAAAEAAWQDERVRRAAELVDAFARARDCYLREVEQEVVKLVVTVAAHILRREVQNDPLLAIGAVRAALGQIAAAGEVRLLVPASDVDLWTEAIALLPHLSVRPKVVAAEEMLTGDCRIESSLGWADLGIRTQLGEMERALFEPSDRAPEAAR